MSTKAQNLDRQLKQLEEEGCEKIYQEKITGTTSDRPELQEMLDELKKGDEVVVSDLTRISRSTIDLVNLVNTITEKGAIIKSLKESWVDMSTSHGKFMMTVFAGLAQFERDLISERTKEGMAVAKEKGRIMGRPKRKSAKTDHALEMYKTGNYTGTEIAEICGISRSTLYRRLREEGLV